MMFLNFLFIYQLLSIDGVKDGGTENLEDFKKERFGKFYTKWYFWLLILLIIAFLVNFFDAF